MYNSSLLKIIVNISALLTALLGILVLIGWYTGDTTFIQIIPVFVPMPYNTALGFFVAGANIFYIYNEKIFVAKITAVIIGLIGLVTLIEYVFGFNLGLYEMFIKDDVVQTSNPVRMAPNTALCFLLYSISSILIIRKIRQVQIAGVLGSMVFGLGFVALTSYLIETETINDWGRLTYMAVHTALGFIVLGIGITVLSWMIESKKNRLSFKKYQSWLFGYAITFAVTFFLIDISQPLGVTTSYYYILIMLLGWFMPKKKDIIILAIVITSFLIIGYFFLQKTDQIFVMLINRFLEIIVIWVVVVLFYKIKTKESLLKEKNEAIIEAQKKAERSEAIFSAITHQSNEGITVADLDGNYIFVNPAFCEMSGYTNEELLKLTVFNMKAKAQPHQSFYDSKEEMEGLPIRVNLQRKNGTEYLTEITGKVIEINNQRLVLGTIRDITDFVKSDEALKDSEYLLRESQEIAKLGSYVLDIASDIWESSVVLDKMFGIDETYNKDVSGWLDLVHPKDRAMMQDYFETTIKTKQEFFDHEYRIINFANKEEIYVNSLGIIEFDKAGNPLKITGTIQDITKYKIAEEAIKASERRWQFAIDGSELGLWDWEITTNKIFLSLKWKAMLGFKGDEISNNHEEWDKRVHPDDKEKAYENINKYLDGKSSFYISEYRLKCKDGTYKWILDRGKIVEWTEDNKPARMIGTHSDITQAKLDKQKILKQNEELLIAKNLYKEKERKLVQAIQITILGYWELNLINNELYWSDEIYKMFELNPKDFGASYEAFLEHIHPDDLNRVDEAYKTSLKNKLPYEIEHRLMLKNGKIKYVLEKCETEYDKRGNAIRSKGTILDISPLRNPNNSTD